MAEKTSSVVAARLGPSLLRRLTAEAERRGMTPNALFKELVMARFGPAAQTNH